MATSSASAARSTSGPVAPVPGGAAWASTSMPRRSPAASRRSLEARNSWVASANSTGLAVATMASASACAAASYSAVRVGVAAAASCAAAVVTSGVFAIVGRDAVSDSRSKPAASGCSLWVAMCAPRAPRVRVGPVLRTAPWIVSQPFRRLHRAGTRARRKRACSRLPGQVFGAHTRQRRRRGCRRSPRAATRRSSCRVPVGTGPRRAGQRAPRCDGSR